METPEEKKQTVKKADRRSLGLCVGCAAPALKKRDGSGFANECGPCRKRRAAWTTQKRKDNHLKGLCWICSIPLPETVDAHGKAIYRCDSCRVKAKQDSAKNRATAKKNGVCSACRIPLVKTVDAAGNALHRCDACRSKAIARAKNLRVCAKARGKCSRCFVGLATRYGAACFACLGATVRPFNPATRIRHGEVGPQFLVLGNMPTQDAAAAKKIFQRLLKLQVRKPTLVFPHPPDDGHADDVWADVWTNELDHGRFSEWLVKRCNRFGVKVLHRLANSLDDLILDVDGVVLLWDAFVPEWFNDLHKRCNEAGVPVRMIGHKKRRTGRIEVLRFNTG